MYEYLRWRYAHPKTIDCCRILSHIDWWFLFERAPRSNDPRISRQRVDVVTKRTDAHYRRRNNATYDEVFDKVRRIFEKNRKIYLWRPPSSRIVVVLSIIGYVSTCIYTCVRWWVAPAYGINIIELEKPTHGYNHVTATAIQQHGGRAGITNFVSELLCPRT